MKPITSFENIPILENTLALCDIDDTILRFEKTLEDCYQDVLETIQSMIEMKEFTSEYLEESIKDTEHLMEVAKMRLNHHQRTSDPVPTDANGFTKLLTEIKNKNGSLAFLTARHSLTEEYTRDHFRVLGIKYDDFQIHYTQDSKLSKSKFLLKYLDKMGNYSNIIVIDDRVDLLEEIESDFPNIETYLFQFNSQKNIET